MQYSKPPLFLLFLFLIKVAFISVAPAQTRIQGEALDEARKPLTDVRVSVNGSDYVSSDAEGKFSLIADLALQSKPQNVQAQKKGYLLKEWSYNANKLQVILSLPKKVQGKVYSNVVRNRRIPVADIQVLLIGVRDLKAVKTDSEGNFTMDIPQSISINENSQFALFDPGRLKSQADYDLKLGEDGLVYIFVNVPPRAVRKVKVWNKAKEIVKNTAIKIDNIDYKTDENGECRNLQEVNDFSGFKVVGFTVNKLEYIDASSTMNVVVEAKADDGNPDTPTTEDLVSIIEQTEGSIQA
jgi:hypothetical protein